MPVRELVGKLLMYAFVVAVSIVIGIFILSTPRAPQDSFTLVTGVAVIGVGVLCAAYGTLSVAIIARETNRAKAASQVHLTPRSGPPAAPPAWGMSDVGRPESGAVEVDRMSGIRLSGKGEVRVVGLDPGLIQNLDAPMLIGVLLIWTLVALIHFAPIITSTPLH